ncbi:Os03g0428000, partial [Oryza sativa Japonica Group]
ARGKRQQRCRGGAGRRRGRRRRCRPEAETRTPRTAPAPPLLPSSASYMIFHCCCYQGCAGTIAQD